MTDDLATFRGSDPRPEASRGGIGRPKRDRALDVPASEKQRIRQAKAQFCRLCGNPPSPGMPINAAHLVPRGMGGTIGGEWVDDNIIGLCGHGNIDGCHSLIDGYDPEACAELRILLTDAEIAYIVRTKGEAWLDRRFPRRAAA